MNILAFAFLVIVLLVSILTMFVGKKVKETAAIFMGGFLLLFSLAGICIVLLEMLNK